MYNFDIIAKQVGMPNGVFMGPGAGNSFSVGVNCEVILTSKISTLPSDISTH